MKTPGIFIPDKKKSSKKLEDLINHKRKDRFKYAPKYNQLHSSDEYIQYFYDLWCEQAFTSDDSKKNSVAEAYCIHVLGISAQTFENFKKGHRDSMYDFADRAIGLRQGGAVERKRDFMSFWKAMKTLFPCDYSQEDINYLAIEKEPPVFQLISQFQAYGSNDLLYKLRINAHNYK